MEKEDIRQRLWAMVARVLVRCGRSVGPGVFQLKEPKRARSGLTEEVKTGI